VGPPSAHRSKHAGLLGAGLAVAALGAACHPAASVSTRTVTMYVPQACAADGSAYADYFALGDFDPSSPLPTGHYLSDVGVALPEIDPRARALMVTANEPSGPPWEGVGPVPATGDVSVLLLPAFTSCPLTTPVGPRTGSVVAPIAGGQVLLVGGTNPAPPTWIARLDTGEVDAVAPDLLTPRTDASVTSFGGGALVAGGTSAGGTVLDTGEVFSSAAGGFDQQNPILLSEPRSHHGAVVMASGQTLLVGGLGGSDGTTVLASMEIVDPSTRTVRQEGVAQLAAARRDPVVLRLASGEILVAG